MKNEQVDKYEVKHNAYNSESSEESDEYIF